MGKMAGFYVAACDEHIETGENQGADGLIPDFRKSVAREDQFGQTGSRQSFQQIQQRLRLLKWFAAGNAHAFDTVWIAAQFGRERNRIRVKAAGEIMGGWVETAGTTQTASLKPYYRAQARSIGPAGRFN